MTPLGAIVIAAHNEQAVIARSLSSLAAALASGVVQVIVVCNGCVDDTATIARRFDSVEVIELDIPSKARALRAGDRLATPGPRIYLDADVVMTSEAAVAVLELLASGTVLAARPPLHFDYTGASWPVRQWYEVRGRLSSTRRALWGAGTYALSVEGRARFAEFPDIVSDDLFIDRLFSPPETAIVETDPVVVVTPRTTADLLRILTRHYRTQSEVQRGEGGFHITEGQRRQLRELVTLVRAQPSLLKSGVVYSAVIVVARLQARWSGAARSAVWERDNSSRSM